MHKLEKEISELKDQIKRLDKRKVYDVGCESCHNLRLENAQLKKMHWESSSLKKKLKCPTTS